MFFLLQLLYVDSVQSNCIAVERSRPVISQWTTDEIKFREDYEKNVIKRFGVGPLTEIIPHCYFDMEEEVKLIVIHK